MHPIIKTFSLAIISVCITGCSPVYKEGNFIDGGYKSVQLAQNEFKIDYRPGLFTDTSDLSGQDHVRMLRAAEVAMEKGYQYFVICYDPTSHPNDRSLYIKCFNEDAPSNAVNAEKFLKYNRKTLKQVIPKVNFRSYSGPCCP